jgi:hypothetical protein
MSHNHVLFWLRDNSLRSLYNTSQHQLFHCHHVDSPNEKTFFCCDMTMLQKLTSHLTLPSLFGIIKYHGSHTFHLPSKKKLSFLLSRTWASRILGFFKIQLTCLGLKFRVKQVMIQNHTYGMFLHQSDNVETLVLFSVLNINLGIFVPNSNVHW